MRYVALGDSYTIGTSVGPAQRWPDQLTLALGSAEPTLHLDTNLAVDGSTSAELIRDQLPTFDALGAEFATVLIGVNDVVRGVAPERYEANVVAILDRLLERLRPDRIVTVATPDYTVTPAGADYGDPARQHDGIVTANGMVASLSAERRIAYVDIFDLSLMAGTDGSLVADDGLHPSGAQYALWVARIQPVVEALIGR